MSVSHKLIAECLAWPLATGWPEYSFVLGNKKPILYIGGHQLLFNRMKVKNDGDKTAYFYCVNKLKHLLFIFCKGHGSSG